MQPQKNNKLPQIKYLLVLDFQATCIENKKLQPCSQIIQFPVVIVNTHTLQIQSQFHQYVKPRFNPILTPFCTQLTGITQQMVQKGKYIQYVLDDLYKWIQSLPYLSQKQGNFTFLTCGFWDINTCLKAQAKHKGLKIPQYLKNYFPKAIKSQEKSRGMTHMLEILGLPLVGKHHSGIDDVKNICSICIQLIKKYEATFPKTEINTSKF